MSPRVSNPALLSGALALLVALPSLRNGFVIDDSYLIVGSSKLDSLAHVGDFFVNTWGEGMGGRAVAGVNAAFYRPLTSTLFALEQAAFGLRPALWHLVSGLLHAAAAALVAHLLLRLSGRRAALAGGALFAVHPVQAEALGPVCYQTTLLSGVLAFAALAAFARVLERGPRPAPLVALGVAALAAGLAKESALALPALLLAWAIVLRPPGWRRCLVPSLATAGGAAAVVLLARHAVLGPPELSFFAGASGSVVVLTMLRVAALYGELLLAPLRLCPFYDWFIVPPESGVSAGVAIGFLFLAAVVAGAVVAWRRGQPLVALGCAWFLFALLPVSQIVPIAIVAAERFLYLPLVGVALAFGVGVSRCAPAERPGRPRIRAVALATLLGLYGARTAVRLLDWHDDEALNRATARSFPETPTPLLNLASVYERQGRVDRALEALAEAARRAPDWPVPRERSARLVAAQRAGAPPIGVKR